MNQTYFEDFCSVFYQLTNCPIHLLSEKQVVLSLPEPPFPFAEHHRDRLFSSEQPINCIISESHLSYGLVKSRSSSWHIILGPYACHECTQMDIMNIMKEYTIPASCSAQITDYFSSLGNGIFAYFKVMLSMVDFILNQRKSDVDKYLPFVSEFHLRKIAGQHTAAMMDVKENQSLHNTYQLEQITLKKIEDGDLTFFQPPAQPVPNLVIGKIADSSLRQSKNLFIVTATLYTRAAIRGGLPIEEAFQLSDQYIQAMEKMLSQDNIEWLQQTMAFDFTERVAASKIPSDIAPEIYHALQYIQLHTNCSISVQDVADAVGCNRSSLSRRFKAALGFDMSSFIMRCKLEEAKSLLVFSDKSLSDISAYLCFSSQSYFNNVFKQKFRMTPKEYRMKNKKCPPASE